ncbi:MAG: hypothetical protein ACLTQI_02805 [Slackia sp.]
MGDIDVRAKLAHWKECVADAELASELDDLSNADDAAIADAFFQDLAFGTAGLRGIIGAGTNRMNIYTVARATQGLADYLNAHFDVRRCHRAIRVTRGSFSSIQRLLCWR